MKYSTATIIVLAQGIFAAPSFLNKIGHKNSKASHQSTGGDITLVTIFCTASFLALCPLARDSYISLVLRHWAGLSS